MESRSGSGSNRAKARNGRHDETKRSVNNLDVGRGNAAERASLLDAMELSAAGHRVDHEGKSVAMGWTPVQVLESNFSASTIVQQLIRLQVLSFSSLAASKAALMIILPNVCLTWQLSKLAKSVVGSELDMRVPITVQPDYLSRPSACICSRLCCSWQSG